jgi:hypothetical protein
LGRGRYERAEEYMHVVKALWGRSLFRTTGTGETLTANYQLARPDMRFGQLPPAPTFTRI